MKQCPNCGVQADDDSRFCEECGCQFPLRLCPQCGEQLDGDEKYCQKCGYNLTSVNNARQNVNLPTTFGPILPQQEQIPQKIQYPQYSEPEKQSNSESQPLVKPNSGSNGKAALLVVLGVLLGLLGATGWAVYTGKVDFGIKLFDKNAKAETDTTIVENDSSDSESHIIINENIVESTEESSVTSSTPEVYMSLWGSIGDSEEVDFEMDGTTGWYSYTRKGVKGPKRTLKLKSFDNLSRRCIIDAYLDGKYIGNFNGIFISDEVDMGDGDTKAIQTYDGVFNSVKGLKIDFYLYID